LWAPKGTPKALIQKINADVTRIANDPAFRDKFVIQRGLTPVFDTPEQFADYLRRSRVVAEATAKRGHLQAQ